MNFFYHPQHKFQFTDFNNYENKSQGEEAEFNSFQNIFNTTHSIIIVSIRSVE